MPRLIIIVSVFAVFFAMVQAAHAQSCKVCAEQHAACMKNYAGPACKTEHQMCLKSCKK
jgi:hypothetical protein